MKIQLKSLEKGQNLIKLTGNFGKKDREELDLLDTATVAGNAELCDDALYLRLEVRCPVKLECSRCLDDFAHQATGKLTAVYSWKKNLKNPEADTYFEYISPETSEINLSQIIRESIILSLPMKPLCTEDCKGLCGGCGENLNTVAACKCKQVTVGFGTV